MLPTTFDLPVPCFFNVFHNPSDFLKLERQLMKVPFEIFSEIARARQRIIEKEMDNFVDSIAEATQKNMSETDALNHLGSLLSRLEELKMKIMENNSRQEMELEIIMKRLNHLQVLQFGGKEIEAKWKQMHVDRILVDYMLKSDCFDAALKLAEGSDIQELVDVKIFLDAKRVIQGLRNRNCSEALAWCAENESKLDNSQDSFEFKLRVQEIVEFLRNHQLEDAVNYAQEYLVPWGDQYKEDVEKVMVAFAFDNCAKCDSCKMLFDLNKWDALIGKFKMEFMRLHGITQEPSLIYHLTAGFICLKTLGCLDRECPIEDPLFEDDIRQLGARLPFWPHRRTKLVCYITKELMTLYNPPLILPNGYAYSKKALNEMASLNNGEVTCPRTGFRCNLRELSVAHINRF
ncbi:hypothetical protein KP509_22G044000 [Ceratopteris richardii]|uniref:Macrophage erythroblast attacher n=1 Tax=Ceratopteris richardii TaxID=49495 RepID=A0A8T2S776_CERRI|nr:hypothetical protein KP509_22G044000 [Ceratopteris richardii]